jgi:hypothetical protein
MQLPLQQTSTEAQSAWLPHAWPVSAATCGSADTHVPSAHSSTGPPGVEATHAPLTQRSPSPHSASVRQEAQRPARQTCPAEQSAVAQHSPVRQRPLQHTCPAPHCAALSHAWHLCCRQTRPRHSDVSQQSPGAQAPSQQRAPGPQSTSSAHRAVPHEPSPEAQATSPPPPAPPPIPASPTLPTPLPAMPSPGAEPPPMEFCVEHCPLMHASPVLHVRQSLPSVPQAAMAPPGWHAPFASQHPTAQGAGPQRRTGGVHEKNADDMSAMRATRRMKFTGIPRERRATLGSARASSRRKATRSGDGWSRDVRGVLALVEERGAEPTEPLGGDPSEEASHGCT